MRRGQSLGPPLGAGRFFESPEPCQGIRLVDRIAFRVVRSLVYKSLPKKEKTNSGKPRADLIIGDVFPAVPNAGGALDCRINWDEIIPPELRKNFTLAIKKQDIQKMYKDLNRHLTDINAATQITRLMCEKEAEVWAMLLMPDFSLNLGMVDYVVEHLWKYNTDGHKWFGLDLPYFFQGSMISCDTDVPGPDHNCLLIIELNGAMKQYIESNAIPEKSAAFTKQQENIYITHTKTETGGTNIGLSRHGIRRLLDSSTMITCLICEPLPTAGSIRDYALRAKGGEKSFVLKELHASQEADLILPPEGTSDADDSDS